MSKSHKAIGYAVGALIGLLVLAAIVLGLFQDFNAYKPRIEAAVSDVLGMEVKADGRLGLGLFPKLHVTLEGVHVRHRGTEVAAANEARIGIEFLSLFHKGVRIDQIALEHPSISIERDVDGTFNFEKSDASRGPLPSLNLSKVSISGATLIYVDRKSGDGFEAADCNLDVRHLQLTGGEGPSIMQQLSFAGELACGEIRTKNYAASDLKLSVAGQRGAIDLKPLTMRVLGGQGSGSLSADYTGTVPRYQIRYSLSQLQIEEFLKPLSPKNLAEGPMDFSANLSMQGATVAELRQSMEGRFSLRGSNLILNGRNLDREFARYESSQHFNLVDVGALFLVGPVGLVVTRGYHFAGIFQGSGGRSAIPTLVSDWNVERGVARAQDVAFATNTNRVALHGGLDFVNQRFDKVTVALIDARGCVRVQQIIRGTFKNPVLEKPSALKSLTGPVTKLLKDVESLFPGGECEVFYAGSVAQPK